MTLKELKVEIEATLNRIPHDLLIWESEMRRLDKKIDKKSNAIKMEYYYQWAYYRGKLMAYLFILQELNNGMIKMTPVTQKYITKMLKAPSLYKGMQPPKLKKL